MLGPSREEVTGRRLHSEEFNNLYSSPNITSRRMRWTEYVQRMGNMKNVYCITKFLSEIQKGRDHMRDLGVYCRIILKHRNEIDI
jgi:hypothetical protein